MDRFIKLLRRLKVRNEVVTVIIKSGQNCCEHTGCIADIVDKSFLVLITSENNTCTRTFIRLNCICAIITPDEIIPPPPPPPPEVCECQVTGAGNITEPDPPGQPLRMNLTVVACPGCTPGPDQLRYQNNLGEDDVELILLPPGPGAITSVSCEDAQAATVEGIAQVIINGVDQGTCGFILDVTEDTIRMRIICNGIQVHDSGVLELPGPSINIREC